MNQYVKKLTEALSTQSPEDPDSILNLLYQCYSGVDSIHSETIRCAYQQLEAATEQLEFEQSNEISTAVVSLCVEYERAAFLDGLRTGARLMQELDK